jgi:hypothetical protein
MKKFSTIMSLMLCVVVSTYAQFYFGGSYKPEKAPVTRNIFGRDASNDFKLYIGEEFIYTNLVEYNANNAPYPWIDGRVRSGKYKSSNTAFAEYLGQLKKLSGKKFKLEKYLEVDNTPGIIFTSETGESYFYPYLKMLTAEFVYLPYKQNMEKKLLNKKFIFMTTNIDKSPYLVSCYINMKTRNVEMTLPQGSEWTVIGFQIDTSYAGDHSEANDIENGFCRLTVIIHNDKLGDFEVFMPNLKFAGFDSSIPSELYSNGVFILKGSDLEKEIKDVINRM